MGDYPTVMWETIIHNQLVHAFVCRFRQSPWEEFPWAAPGATPGTHSDAHTSAIPNRNTMRICTVAARRLSADPAQVVGVELAHQVDEVGQTHLVARDNYPNLLVWDLVEAHLANIYW